MRCRLAEPQLDRQFDGCKTVPPPKGHSHISGSFQAGLFCNSNPQRVFSLTIFDLASQEKSATAGKLGSLIRRGIIITEENLHATRKEESRRWREEILPL